MQDINSPEYLEKLVEWTVDNALSNLALSEGAIPWRHEGGAVTARWRRFWNGQYAAARAWQAKYLRPRNDSKSG